MLPHIKMNKLYKGFRSFRFPLWHTDFRRELFLSRKKAPLLPQQINGLYMLTFWQASVGGLDTAVVWWSHGLFAMKQQLIEASSEENQKTSWSSLTSPSNTPHSQESVRLFYSAMDEIFTWQAFVAMLAKIYCFKNISVTTTTKLCLFYCHIPPNISEFLILENSFLTNDIFLSCTAVGKKMFCIWIGKDENQDT